MRLQPRHLFWIKVLIHLAGILPLLWLFLTVNQGWLSADPAKDIQHFTGRIALKWLLATLAIAPLARYGKQPLLIRCRRPVGLWCFAWATLHLTSYALLELGLSHLSLLVSELFSRPYLTLGIVSWIILLALALTSTQAMHLAGALGRAILPNLTIPDQVLPELMIAVLPPLAAGIFLAAPMAAIMSNINAHLLQASATIVKDLYLSVHPQRASNERYIKHLSSLTTLVLGLLVLLASWRPPEMIIWLNLLAFGGLEAVFLWPLVLGLYWERANATGALCAMIGGALCYTLLASFKIQWGGFHPIVPALTLSLLAFIIGNRFGHAAPAAVTSSDVK